jgi:hypothetical protein
MDNLRFEEKQAFRQKTMYLVFALLLLLTGVLIYGDIQQLILGKAFGSKPAANYVLVITTLFLLIMLVLSYMAIIAELQTVITDKGVCFRLTPFRKAFRQLDWSNIDAIEIINYGFAGLGLRLTPYGKVYNAGGNSGLKLVLKSGKKVILGTQKPEELSNFLRKIRVMQ